MDKVVRLSPNSLVVIYESEHALIFRSDLLASLCLSVGPYVGSKVRWKLFFTFIEYDT